MGIKVTVYNDDPNGRTIQVMKVNTRAGGVFERRVMESSDDGRGEGPYCVNINQDEMLLVLPAEPTGPKPETAIDTTNDHLVGVLGPGIAIVKPPVGPMTREAALRLAAHIVALAEERADEFRAVLDAVRNT